MKSMGAQVFAYLVAGTLLAALGQIFFKVGSTGRTSLEGFLNVWVASGALCYALGTILWIYSLSKAPLTVVYPFTALTFVFVYAAGVMLLGEGTSTKAMIGVGLVLIGLYLVSTPA